MPGTCPHCDAEIDHLNYEEGRREWGYADLDGENTECEDSEISGDTTYTCPECDEILEPNDVIMENDEEIEVEATPLNWRDIAANETIRHTEQTSQQPQSDMIVQPRGTTPLYTTCPNCGERLLLEGIEDIQCHICKTIINPHNTLNK